MEVSSVADNILEALAAPLPSSAPRNLTAFTIAVTSVMSGITPGAFAGEERAAKKTDVSHVIGSTGKADTAAQKALKR